jgi:hypothetical protein
VNILQKTPPFFLQIFLHCKKARQFLIKVLSLYRPKIRKKLDECLWGYWSSRRALIYKGKILSFMYPGIFLIISAMSVSKSSVSTAGD